MTHQVLFDRDIYFDAVRASLFGGALTQDQVTGQEAILLRWEVNPPCSDLRHLAYPLATTKHETASTMMPIEEYGKGKGHEYGNTDPETGQAYYGRGYVQLTWRDNYCKATKELQLEGDDDLEWHCERALDPGIAAEVMFCGMEEGWFRPPNTLSRFFNDDTDDAYGAREIINGDKHIVPSWSNGVSIGNLIAGYHEHFLAALIKSSEAATVIPISIDIVVPAGVRIDVTVNGLAFSRGGRS
jgi:putative chitinase